MFLHLSVSHSVHGGGVSAPVHAGIHTPHLSRHPSLGRHPPPLLADTSPLGGHPPQQTATAADGTHPTGMHSCWQTPCQIIGFCSKIRGLRPLARRLGNPGPATVDILIFLSRSPDGTCILTCSNDNCLRIFNLPEELYYGKITSIPEMVKFGLVITSISTF